MAGGFGHWYLRGARTMLDVELGGAGFRAQDILVELYKSTGLGAAHWSRGPVIARAVPVASVGLLARGRLPGRIRPASPTGHRALASA